MDILVNTLLSSNDDTEHTIHKKYNIIIYFNQAQARLGSDFTLAETKLNVKSLTLLSVGLRGGDLVYPDIPDFLMLV